MSKRWSCDTLAEGFKHVMCDTLEDEELKLQKEIEDFKSSIQHACT